MVGCGLRVGLFHSKPTIHNLMIETSRGNQIGFCYWRFGFILEFEIFNILLADTGNGKLLWDVVTGGFI